nr:phosphoglycerate mutase family protein [Rhodococcus sp. JVH1]
MANPDQDVNEPVELIIVRHGRPGNPRESQNPADPPLGDLGHRQARRVAEHLKAEGADRVHSSSLLRAAETAATIARELDVRLTFDPDLAEFDRDATEYLFFEDLIANKDPRYDAYLREDLSPWGTDVTSFRSRVARAFDRLLRECRPGERVVVVCHGGVLNAYLGGVLGIAEFMFHDPEYTSISRVLVDHGRSRRLVSINESGHLRRQQNHENSH